MFGFIPSLGLKRAYMSDEANFPPSPLANSFLYQFGKSISFFPARQKFGVYITDADGDLAHKQPNALNVKNFLWNITELE